MKNQPPSTMPMSEVIEYYGADKVNLDAIFTLFDEAETVQDVLEDYCIEAKDLKAELERLYDLEGSLKEKQEELDGAVETLIEIRDYKDDNPEYENVARANLAHDWLERNNK